MLEILSEGDPSVQNDTSQNPAAHKPEGPSGFGRGLGQSLSGRVSFRKGRETTSGVVAPVVAPAHPPRRPRAKPWNPRRARRKFASPGPRGQGLQARALPGSCLAAGVQAGSHQNLHGQKCVTVHAYRRHWPWMAHLARPQQDST